MNYKKICIICKKEFETTYSKKVYCSPECKKIGDNKQHVEKRKEKAKSGICWMCGNKIEEDRLGKSICLSCTKKQSLKSKNKYNNVSTKILCDYNCLNCKFKDCILEDNENTFRENKIKKVKEYRLRHLEEHKQSEKDRYQKRKENGLCVRCGNKRENLKFVLCDKCREYNKNRLENERRKNGALPKQEYFQIRNENKENGICWFCDEPSIPGKNTCEHHYKLYKQHWKKFMKPILDEKNKQSKIKYHLKKLLEKKK